MPHLKIGLQPEVLQQAARYLFQAAAQPNRSHQAGLTIKLLSTDSTPLNFLAIAPATFLEAASFGAEPFRVTAPSLVSIDFKNAEVRVFGPFG